MTVRIITSTPNEYSVRISGRVRRPWKPADR